jgi:hypothetical protein
MGFFSSIGGAVGAWIGGPIAAPLLSAFGGIFDGKKAKKAQQAQINEQNRIATIAAENASRPVVTTQKVDFNSTIKDATNAGFNPLTALRATGGNITGTTTRYVAPLLSSMPTRNFTDILSDAFSGYQSFQKGRTQKLQLGLETDLLKSQLALNMKNLSDDGFTMEKINLGARFKDPMTGTEFIGLNPEAFEMGVSELSGSAAMHASFAGTQVFGTGTANTSQKVKKNLDNLGGYLDNQLQTFKNKYFIKPKASTQLLSNNTSTYGDDVVTYSMKALGLEY